jgi:hypothetical protein
MARRPMQPRHKPIDHPTKRATLSVAPERQAVVLLPGLPAASRCLVELVSFSETTRLLASSGETTGFAVLR